MGILGLSLNKNYCFTEIHKGTRQEKTDFESENPMKTNIVRAEASFEPSTEIQYYIHADTKQICFRIINKETNEIIKEIPSEKMLDVIADIWKLAGLFVDKRA